MIKTTLEKEIEKISLLESIQSGVKHCSDAVAYNRQQARLFLWLFFMAFALIVLLISGVFTLNSRQAYINHTELESLLHSADKEILKTYLDAISPRHYFSDSLLVTMLVFGTTISGIVLALYRMHTYEANKYEYYKLSLVRARIAIAYASEEDLVLQELTTNLFQYFQKSNADRREIESPIQGAPASEFAAVLLNRIDDLAKKAIKKQNR